jgi:hypothetical protein
MSLFLAAFLTLIATLAAIAASGIAWPRQVIRAGQWLERLDDDRPVHGRHARHADVASVPAPPSGTAAAPPEAGLTRATQHDGLAALAAIADRQAAPWPDADEPVGWPVFATSADMPVIEETGSPVRRYVLDAGYRGGAR